MSDIDRHPWPWPADANTLASAQERLARERPECWTPPEGALLAAGCAVVAWPGDGDRVGSAAAVLVEAGRGPPSELERASLVGELGGPFTAGLLALREGPLLEAAVRQLSRSPHVLLVHAAGRDHPRRAGLALMLGAVLRLPSVGVTTRPMRASGSLPGSEAGARSPLMLDGEVVAYWIRTRAGARPVVAHAGWRTTAEVAAGIVLRVTHGVRMPEPIRRSFELARERRGET